MPETMVTHQAMDRREWLSLHLIHGLGNVGFRNLLSRFGTPDSVFRAPLRKLMEVEGVRPETAERIVKRHYSAEPAWVLEEVDRQGARLVYFEEPEYPFALKEIHDPPMVLYVKGTKSTRQRTGAVWEARVLRSPSWVRALMSSTRRTTSSFMRRSWRRAL
jgi:DNA processing protein